MDELVAGLKSVRQKLCILNLNSSSSKYLSLPSRHSNTKTFFLIHSFHWPRIPETLLTHLCLLLYLKKVLQNY